MMSHIDNRATLAAMVGLTPPPHGEWQGNDVSQSTSTAPAYDTKAASSRAPITEIVVVAALSMDVSSLARQKRPL